MQERKAGGGVPAMETVASRLRAAREALNLSQQGFADLMGVKRQQVIDVERGKSKPSPELQAAAVQKACVNPLWLAGGTGPMFQKRALSFEEVAELAREAELEAQALDVPDEMRRSVQDWLIAVKTRNAQRVRELCALYSGKPKGAPAIDERVLEVALRQVEDAIAVEGMTADARKRAALICAVYDLAASQGDVMPQLVRRLARLAR